MREGVRRTLVAVCGYGKTPSNGYRRVDRAATTYEGAVQSMLKSMKAKKLRCSSDVPAHTDLSLDRSDILYQMKHGVPQGFELSSRLAHIEDFLPTETNRHISQVEQMCGESRFVFKNHGVHKM
ncbi:hypothetical protein OSTOST_19682 [Ostertagia ostertagi]